MDKDNFQIEEFENLSIRDEIMRYVSFWPWFMISLFLFLSIAFFYLRYTDYSYFSKATIEILDESQDSEMALPTSLTVFNRSMINLENEINVLSSYSLHKLVVEKLKSNVKFYTIGNIKTSENFSSDWFSSYEIEYKTDTNLNSKFQEFEIEVDNTDLIINTYSDEDESISFKFNNLTTLGSTHDLPFELTINTIKRYEKRILVFLPVNSAIEKFRKLTKIVPIGKDSDQLQISMTYPNPNISEQYINALLEEFDKDGIKDRQLEYKNTIDFVDMRSKILRDELRVIELRKQNFKEKNSLSDLKSNTNVNIEQQFQYDSELFVSESQKSLASYLLSSFSDKTYDYIPLNIGLENFDLNILISEYNGLLRERDKFLLEAGPNNSYVKTIEKQLEKYLKNIKNSVVNYLNTLDLKIDDLRNKEEEFLSVYNNVPENEKLLRSIERELTVKESLFLLLLQKREEASINFAVVKPTIKVIDYSITDMNPVSPNILYTFIVSISMGLFIPFIFLYFRFVLDNKIHTKQQLEKYSNNLPIIGELPFINNVDELAEVFKNQSRSSLAEGIRMMLANLRFTNLRDENSTILVTSTIKGEGKTIISVNTASLLSSKNKRVLLIGADLRNPQIHKLLGVDKNILGLSDMLYKKDIENYKKYILNFQKIDVILSGTIPPNPTQLLSSSNFKNFIESVRKDYDHVVVDSAPCLLVSDTLEISNLLETTVYVVRANFLDKNLISYINENVDQKRLNNVSLVLNGVGNSSSYGYKYGYQYGYKYGYKYGYNYGYGYGYGEDSLKK